MTSKRTIITNIYEFSSNCVISRIDNRMLITTITSKSRNWKVPRGMTFYVASACTSVHPWADHKGIAIKTEWKSSMGTNLEWKLTSEKNSDHQDLNFSSQFYRQLYSLTCVVVASFEKVEKRRKKSWIYHQGIVCNPENRTTNTFHWIEL